MDEEKITEWANAYIQAELTHGLNADHPQWWAVEKFMGIGSGDTNAQDSMKAILVILNLEPPDKVIAVLAAGPLEDLIENCGEEVIDQIELLARQNPKFRHLLGGVWECGTPDIWTRVTVCRGEAW
ncbi:MAG: hypothetical protein KUF72_05285 [Candidatus Thiodiazotropha sp. (ex Ctena orbiculata)]|nr:hypothetical protein [Candidatus Thiodiazotropha taylori]